MAGNSYKSLFRGLNLKEIPSLVQQLRSRRLATCLDFQLVLTFSSTTAAFRRQRYVPGLPSSGDEKSGRYLPAQSAHIAFGQRVKHKGNDQVHHPLHIIVRANAVSRSEVEGLLCVKKRQRQKDI